MGDADDLVQFLDVNVIRSAAPALLCLIGDQRVWLPRRHISGKLWCTGDRGKLLIPRWLARDRNLIWPGGSPRLAEPSGRGTVIYLHREARERDDGDQGDAFRAEANDPGRAHRR